MQDKSKLRQLEQLKRDLRNEVSRLNTMTKKAAKTYGPDSIIVERLEEKLSRLALASRSYVQRIDTVDGLSLISLSEKNIDRMSRTAIINEMGLEKYIKKSKQTSIMSIVNALQDELKELNIDAADYDASKLTVRREIAKKYRNVRRITTSWLWEYFGSEMGNVKKYEKYKEALSVLSDLNNIYKINFNTDASIEKLMEMWSRGTNVRQLTNDEIEELKNI